MTTIMSRACAQGIVLYAPEMHKGCDVDGCECGCHLYKPVVIHDVRQAVTIVIVVMLVWVLIALLLWALYVLSQ